MIHWIKTHKTEIGFSIALLWTSFFTGCALFGVNAGDLVPAKTPTELTEPLGFDGKGMSVNEAIMALSIADRKERERQAAYLSAREPFVQQLTPRKELADNLDLTFAQVGEIGTGLVANTVSGVTIGGVGIGAMLTPMLGLLLGRKWEHAAWDEATNQTSVPREPS